MMDHDSVALVDLAYLVHGICCISQVILRSVGVDMHYAPICGALQADAHRHALAFTAGDLGQTSLAFVCRSFLREVFCDMDILAVSGIGILFFHRGELGISCRVTRLISVYMCYSICFLGRVSLPCIWEKDD